MTHIDVFNGDADGICALTQLRSAEPRETVLVTGVKRDIELVAKVDAAPGDVVTVLDVSFDKNREGVVRALDAGASVFYVDHHFAGEIPEHAGLRTLIDTAPDVCTSLLVNRHLEGRFAAWAVTGAFGDNLDASAERLAASIGLDAEQQAVLRRLGTCINYNGYGASEADLHFRPADLFGRLRAFADPLEFVRADRATFEQLAGGYDADMASAAALQALRATEHAAVFALPDAPWARRVSGVYSNDLANGSPARAHAVITENRDGSYLVSVRAPLLRKTGADVFCRQFPTGGGRAAAAGINALPAADLDAFVERFCAFFVPGA